MEFFSYFRFRLNIYHEFQIPYTGVHKYIQDKELYESPIKFWSFSSINVSWSRHINAVISSFNDHENHSRSFPLSKKSRCPFSMGSLSGTERPPALIQVSMHLTLWHTQANTSYREPQKVTADSGNVHLAVVALCVTGGRVPSKPAWFFTICRAEIEGGLGTVFW